MGTERMIEVPLHEYEELVRDSERLRIITEKAVGAAKRKFQIQASSILEVAGYRIPEADHIAPAQKIRPDKTGSTPSVSLTVPEALKEVIYEIFPQDIARELKKQMEERNK